MSDQPHYGPSRHDTAIVIPARLASTRLPDKPLADIAGEPMIARVWARAQAADIGAVLVATPDRRIAEVIEARGGQIVMTDPDLPSGSDRVQAALAKADREGIFTTVVNLQGDMPTITADMIKACLEPLVEPAVDIATLVVESEDEAEKTDPNAVKADIEIEDGRQIGRARNFSRALPEGHTGPHYHHIGIYAYRRTALETFVKLPPSIRERRESLEQLRALDARMRIDAALVDSFPVGVDTPADLERVRAEIAREPASGK